MMNAKERTGTMASAPLSQQSASESSAAEGIQEWNIQISGDASKELDRVAMLTGYSVDRVLAIAINIIGIIADARLVGNRLFLVTKRGRTLKEIFIPEMPS